MVSETIRAVVLLKDMVDVLEMQLEKFSQPAHSTRDTLPSAKDTASGPPPRYRYER
jgi:hypothetical protein